MLVPLAALLVAAASDPDARWTTLLAVDEVTVEVDAASLGGQGTVRAQLRWTFADRAAAPDAWDAGVRYALDVLEVDCRAGTSRTWSSAAFTHDGGAVATMSFAEASPAWRKHRVESVGGIVARGVCAVAGKGGAPR